MEPSWFYIPYKSVKDTRIRNQWMACVWQDLFHDPADEETEKLAKAFTQSQKSTEFLSVLCLIG